ncbi:MAG TPA: DUF5683 domain-containing protein [Longimicrobium sp.]|nr:DUF5683 domain-containing protein [Longimicrobium sp.]
MIPQTWRRLALLTVPLVLAAAPARAQVTDTLRLGERQRQPMVPDTARARRPAVTDSSQQRYRISPRSAFLRSLVLPGWGQSSIGASGRGAVYFALESGSLWMLYKADQKLDEAKRLEQSRRDEGLLQPGQPLPLVRARRNEREDWITLSVFWFFFSGADAFVSAYLRDFDSHVDVGAAPTGGVQFGAVVPLGN